MPPDTGLKNRKVKNGTVTNGGAAVRRLPSFAVRGHRDSRFVRTSLEPVRRGCRIAGRAPRRRRSPPWRPSRPAPFLANGASSYLGVGRRVPLPLAGLLFAVTLNGLTRSAISSMRLALMKLCGAGQDTLGSLIAASTVPSNSRLAVRDDRGCQPESPGLLLDVAV